MVKEASHPSSKEGAVVPAQEAGASVHPSAGEVGIRIEVEGETQEALEVRALFLRLLSGDEGAGIHPHVLVTRLGNALKDATAHEVEQGSVRARISRERLTEVLMAA